MGLLRDHARRRCTLTYADAAARLELAPPRSIHRLTIALEQLMAEDVAAGRPLLAAVVVSRRAGGLPAAGFFAAARTLGAYTGDETGPAAVAFHRGQLEAVFARPALWDDAGASD